MNLKKFKEEPQLSFQSVKTLNNVFLLGIKKEGGSIKRKSCREEELYFKGYTFPRCSVDEVFVL